MKKVIVSTLGLILGLITILGVLTSYAPHTLAAEVYIYEGQSIQEAINVANDEDVIIIHPGTYYENIDFKGKAITVKSTDPEDLEIVHATIIDGNSAGSVVIFCNEERSASILSGITVRNGRADYEADYSGYYPYPGFVGAGIYCSSSSPTITNCNINNNMGGGIYCESSSPTINYCTIRDNTGGGIYCHSSSPTINNCTISDNTASYGGGGISCYSSSPIITNCTIMGNSATSSSYGGYGYGYYGGNGGGIYCHSSSLTITNCILWNNSPQEISIFEDSSLTVTYSDIQQETGPYPGVGNINADPLFVGSEAGNYYLSPHSPCIDTGTPTNAPSDEKEGIIRPQGSGIDMGAYEYVGPASCTPRASFTANQTTGTDSLLVEFDASSSGGSQYSGAVFSWDFGVGTSGSGMTVSHTYTGYGSYDVSLIITTGCGSHRLRLSDLIKIKSSQVTKEVGEGYAYTSIQAAIDDAGYGEMILVHDGTYIENINFKGKVITLFSENGPATTIIDGSGSGSVATFDHCEGIDSVLEGFTLQNGLASNYAYGIYGGYGGYSAYGGNGGGIYCVSSSPIIANCTIRGNSATSPSYGGYYGGNGGGIYCVSSSPTITNCIISGNTSDNGGGLYCEDNSSPTITNCTINDNSGGGVVCDTYSGYYSMYGDSSSSSPKITNCILWNNSPQEISIFEDSSLTVTYSDIQQETGPYPGVGNINADPLFVESGVGNYYLSPNSPCIDTGTPTNAPSDDKEGIIRPQGSGIDMGAYEYVGPASCTPRASFTANQTTGTDSLLVEFDASSSGGSQYIGAIFSWDFGVGTSGSGMTVSHTYTGYGSYDVSLTITTGCGSHRLRLSDLIKIKSSQVISSDQRGGRRVCLYLHSGGY